MSDIRLVNVVPIVNGWNDAAKKNLEEAKTLMASGNHLDYNKGVVKESVANLVSGFADDLMSAPFIDPETLRPMAHWDGQYGGYYDGEPVVRCKDCEHFKNYGKTSLLADGKNISIRPEWCVKILNGEKTVEIRKNRPKLKPPFKCYIYCTKAPKKLITIFRDGDVFGDGEVYRGKPQFVTWDGGNIPIEIRQKEQTVIAEFVCDKIRPIIGKAWIVKEDIERATSGSCLSLKQIIEYAGWSHCSSFTERKELYAWHISDLKIYDQPKSLSGFSRHDFRGMNGTDVCGNESCEHYQPSGSYMLPPTCAINGCCLSKPPQSWCYVAEAEEDDAL